MIKLFASAAALALVLGLSGTAFAGGKNVCAPGTNTDLFLEQYGAGGPEETGSPTPGGVVNTLGGALSGGFYGNTSNAGISPFAPDSGGVTPSISPGPQVVGGDGPGTGTSIGAFIQLSCPPS